MTICQRCEEFKRQVPELHEKIAEQRKTINRLSRFEGGASKAQADRLRDKASRMEQRLKSAVARAEARVKIAYGTVGELEMEAEELREHRNSLFLQLQEKDKIIAAKDLSIDQLRRQGAKGPRELEKRDFLLLKRVQKHLTNPKTGKPYKGGEALCKEIARALVRP